MYIYWLIILLVMVKFLNVVEEIKIKKYEKEKNALPRNIEYL